MYCTVQTTENHETTDSDVQKNPETTDSDDQKNPETTDRQQKNLLEL